MLVLHGRPGAPLAVHAIPYVNVQRLRLGQQRVLLPTQTHLPSGAIKAWMPGLLQPHPGNATSSGALFLHAASINKTES